MALVFPLTNKLHEGRDCPLAQRSNPCPARALAERGQASLPPSLVRSLLLSDSPPRCQLVQRGAGTPEPWLLPRGFRRRAGSHVCSHRAATRHAGTVFFRNLPETKPCLQEENKELFPFLNQNTVFTQGAWPSLL